MSGVGSEPCLIYNQVTKQWSVEARPSGALTADVKLGWSNAEWSGAMSRAADDYRKHGKITPQTRQERYRMKLKLRAQRGGREW